MAGATASWRARLATRPWLADGALALLLAAASLPLLWVVDPQEPPLADYGGPSPLSVLLALAINLPLAWRRVAPITVLAVITVAASAASVLPMPYLGFSMVVALYTVAVHRSRPQALVALLGVLLAGGLALATQGQLRYLPLNVLFLGAVTLFGDWQRLQRARAAELAGRGEELERARVERARLAVQDERQRIAAELRDVLAHAVTAMITQAQAAARLVRREPDCAEDALASVERTGRGALVELRRLVRLLRTDEPADTPADPASPTSSRRAEPDGDPEGARSSADASPSSAATAAEAAAPPATLVVGPSSSAAARVVASPPHAARVGDQGAMGSWLQRLRRRVVGVPARLQDLLLAAAVLVLELATLSLLRPADVGLDGYDGPGLASVAVLTAMSGVLVWRRRYPQAVLVGTLVGASAVVALNVPAQLLAPLVALYTVAGRTGRKVSLAWLGAYLALAAGLMAVDGSLAFYLGIALVVSAAWLLGDRQRVSRAYREDLELRAAQLELARRREVALALAEERARIARDLHDVVANTLGVMIVQARGAHRLLRRDPDRAAAAVEQVLDSGRESLRSLRGMLTVLGDEGGSFAPQPRLDELEDLLEDFRAAGLQVALEVEGEGPPLSPGVELSAYRIVQEALANVLKHAGTDHALVRIGHDDALTIEVCDDGAGPARRDLADTGGGHGLIGMAERARLVGGTLEVGARSGGGFRVRAWLPTGATTAASSPQPGVKV